MLLYYNNNILMSISAFSYLTHLMLYIFSVEVGTLAVACILLAAEISRPPSNFLLVSHHFVFVVVHYSLKEILTKIIFYDRFILITLLQPYSIMNYS